MNVFKNNLPLQEVIEYLCCIITDELLLKMVEESNKCALQIDKTKPLNFSKADIEQFIGFLYVDFENAKHTRLLGTELTI